MSAPVTGTFPAVSLSAGPVSRLPAQKAVAPASLCSEQQREGRRAAAERSGEVRCAPFPPGHAYACTRQPATSSTVQAPADSRSTARQPANMAADASLIREGDYAVVDENGERKSIQLIRSNT